MLAQSFMPAKDLGITDVQRSALITVLGMLERGELTHVKTDGLRARTDFVQPVAGLFNMAQWSNQYDCGTVCCLGGTVEAVGGFRFREGEIHGPLFNLFYPFNAGGISFDDITTAHTATALRKFLTTGEPRWSEAVAP